MLSPVGHNDDLLCTRIWKQLQVEVSVDLCAYTTIDCSRDTINVFHSGTDTRVPPAFRNGSICAPFLIRCNSCQVASCESRDCRGSSEPPLMRCITHLKEVLCLPCLEYQDSMWLERCPGCNSWCRAKDQLSSIGPVGIVSYGDARPHSVSSRPTPITHAFTLLSQSPV